MFLQVCDTCKELDALRDSSLILLKKVRHDLKRAQRPGASSKDDGTTRSCSGLSLKSAHTLEKLEKAVDTIYTQACVLSTSHHQLDVEIRQFIKKTVRLAKHLDALFLASDRKEAGDDAHVPFRSRNGIFVVHVDDKSAVQDPHALRTAQEKLSRYERVFNGHFDLVQV